MNGKPSYAMELLSPRLQFTATRRRPDLQSFRSHGSFPKAFGLVSSSDENQVVCRTLRRRSCCWPTALVSLLTVRQSKRGHSCCVESKQWHSPALTWSRKRKVSTTASPSHRLSCSMLSAEVLATDTEDVLATTTDSPDSFITAARV
jgi:hypothetical protein